MSLGKKSSIGWTISVAATMVACTGVASANSLLLERDLVRSGCSGEVFCKKPVVLQFTTTSQNVTANVTNIVGNVQKCPKIAVFATYDGGNTTYAYPVSNGTSIPLAPGNHSVSLDGVCQEPGPAPFLFDHWGGHIQIFAANTAAPAPAAHTVTGDVDLYDKPGGNGRIIGHLKKGDAVTLNGSCPMNNPKNHDDATNGWCLITDTTQNANGAVWGDFISR